MAIRSWLHHPTRINPHLNIVRVTVGRLLTAVTSQWPPLVTKVAFAGDEVRNLWWRRHFGLLSLGLLIRYFRVYPNPPPRGIRINRPKPFE